MDSSARGCPALLHHTGPPSAVPAHQTAPRPAEPLALQRRAGLNPVSASLLLNQHTAGVTVWLGQQSCTTWLFLPQHRLCVLELQTLT